MGNQEYKNKSAKQIKAYQREKNNISDGYLKHSVYQAWAVPQTHGGYHFRLTWIGLMNLSFLERISAEGMDVNVLRIMHDYLAQKRKTPWTINHEKIFVIKC